MPENHFDVLIDAIAVRQSMIRSYLYSENTRISFPYKHLEQAVYSYLEAGGKSLRPAVLMFSCGAVGGDEEKAIPAAAAIELYHTFTLVHDDIIDHDQMRRGVPTVHYDFAQRARNELGFDDALADHYGLALAILTGDLQQGWAASLLPDLAFKYGLPPELALHITRTLFRDTQIALINGETVDIMQAATPVDQLTENEVLEMLWQKTGSLYEFAGRVGASIGLEHQDLNHPIADAVAKFTGQCGIAFQIQDDVLGLIGNQKRIGKPVGSDIREGKRTIIVLHSLKQMSDAEQAFTLSVLGNEAANQSDVEEVTGLLEKAGGIRHAQELAQRYVATALEQLEVLDPTPFKQLLYTWAQYIIERQR